MLDFGVENIFLIVLALVWLIFASIHDLRKREVANWLNFSLIAFALGFRGFYSIFSGNYLFLVYGLIGFGIFFILANLFYYSRLFAGGDAKLLMGLGVILPFSNFYGNLKIFALFILLLLFIGSIYGLVWSLVLVFNKRKEFSKEFKKQFSLLRKLFFVAVCLAFIFCLVVLILGEWFLLLLPLVVLLFPILLSYAKAVEEVAFVKSVRTSELTEGDWLYENLLINGKKIKASWEGLTRRDLDFLKKNYKGRVAIKQGIPFVPSFLLAFILLLFLWESFWSFF